MSVKLSKLATLTLILLLPSVVVGQSDLLPLPGAGTTRQVTQLFEAPSGEPTPANLQPTPGATTTPTPSFGGNILQLPGTDLIQNGSSSGQDTFQSVNDSAPFESPLAIGNGAAPQLTNSRCGPGGCPNGNCSNKGNNLGPQIYTGLDPNSSLMAGQNQIVNSPLSGAASVYSGAVPNMVMNDPNATLGFDGITFGAPPVATGSPLPCSTCSNGGGAPVMGGPVLSAPSASIAGYGPAIGGEVVSADGFVDSAPCGDSCSSGNVAGGAGVGGFASGLFSNMFSRSWAGGCGGGCGRVRGACNGCPRWYGSAQYIHWWTRGQQTPALVSTSPLGTPIDRAGVLGLPGTQTLLGGRQAANGFSGGLFTFGYNLDCRGCNSIEVPFFFLGTQNQIYDRTASGGEILTRPFYNVLTGQQDAEFVGFPGLVEGRMRISSDTNFRGYGVRLRHNLLSCNPCFTRTGGACNSCCDTCCGGGGLRGGCGGGCGGGIASMINSFCNGGGIRGIAARRQPVRLRSFDLLLGWRHFDLDESLRFEENLTSIDPTNGIPVGTTLDIVDEFRTQNSFDGVDVGLNWEWGSCRWGFNLMAALAIGCTQSTAIIDGSTTITVPDTDPVFHSGGLLALDSNIGRYESEKCSVIPQLGANMYYCLFPGARLTLGYNLIYFDDVQRPGGMIDSGIDPRLLPPKVDGYVNRPGYVAQTDNFWAQGINFGVEFCF